MKYVSGRVLAVLLATGMAASPVYAAGGSRSRLQDLKNKMSKAGDTMVRAYQQVDDDDIDGFISSAAVKNDKYDVKMAYKRLVNKRNAYQESINEYNQAVQGVSDCQQKVKNAKQNVQNAKNQLNKAKSEYNKNYKKFMLASWQHAANAKAHQNNANSYSAKAKKAQNKAKEFYNMRDNEQAQYNNDNGMLTQLSSQHETAMYPYNSMNDYMYRKYGVVPRGGDSGNYNIFNGTANQGPWQADFETLLGYYRAVKAIEEKITPLQQQMATEAQNISTYQANGDAKTREANSNNAAAASEQNAANAETQQATNFKNSADALKNAVTAWQNEVKKREDEAEEAKEDLEIAKDVMGMKSDLKKAAKSALEAQNSKYGDAARDLVKTWNKYVGKNTKYKKSLNEYNRAVDAYNSARKSYEKLKYGHSVSAPIEHMTKAALAVSDDGVVTVTGGVVNVNGIKLK